MIPRPFIGIRVTIVTYSYYSWFTSHRNVYVWFLFFKLISMFGDYLSPEPRSCV